MKLNASDDAFLREMEEFFHSRIPVTRSMGVAVETFDEGGLVLTAPLAANHNHLGTAFGGSLAAVATLAGYGVVWSLLDELAAHVVIKDSALRYLHPVMGAIRARCKVPDEVEWELFRAKFRKSGKARILLEVEICEGGRTCVEFRGTFVALKSA